MNETDPNAQGIHDNPVSGRHQTILPRCLEKEGPAHRVEEGPKPHNPPSTNPQAPTGQTNQRIDIPHLVPYCLRPTGHLWLAKAMLLILTNQMQAPANQECPGQPLVIPMKKITIKKKTENSPGVCQHALRQEVETIEADLDKNWARPEKQKRSCWIGSMLLTSS